MTQDKQNTVLCDDDIWIDVTEWLPAGEHHLTVKAVAPDGTTFNTSCAYLPDFGGFQCPDPVTHWWPSPGVAKRRKQQLAELRKEDE